MTMNLSTDRGLSLAGSDTGDEQCRCFECRRVWPRAQMRWGTRPFGPVWLARGVRVMRCPDCLPG